jgi:hypothetical protein
MERYQVFYNVMTEPEWVIVDTTRRNIWNNYWLEAAFEAQADAEATARAWNAAGSRHGLTFFVADHRSHAGEEG